MNPLKINKVQFGFTEQSPSVSEIDGKLSFYDSQVGNIRLDQFVSSRFIDSVQTVAKGAQGSDFNTISEAIQASVDGGVVIVYGGEYEENLNIDKNIHLFCFGKTTLKSEDTTAITISSSTVSISNLEIVITNGLGNPIPYCVNTTHTDVGETIVLKDCIFDVSSHINAKFFKSNKVSSFFYSCEFKGSRDIEIDGSSYNHFLGAKIPNISLTNIVGSSHIVGDVEDLTLVNSGVSISGSFDSCNGDATSSVRRDTIVGSVTFDNVDSVAIAFDCPLPSTNYVVFVQNLVNGEHPVVTQKTTTGVTISVSQNINEVVYFTIIQ